MTQTKRLVFLFILVLFCCLAAYLLGPGDPGPTAPDRASARGAAPGDDYVPPLGTPPGTSDSDDEAANGGEARPGGADPDASSDEEADAEDEGEFSFEDETPYLVRVRVLDATGAPLKSVVEIVDHKHAWKMGLLPKEETGVFRGYLPGPGRYAAVADWEGTQRRVAFRITDGTPNAAVDIRLEGTASVSGVVLASSGAPDEGVRSDARLFAQEDLAVDLVPDRGPGEEIVPLLSAQVDPRGRYRIAGVPAGTYILRVPNKFYAALVSVPEGAHVTHDIQLRGGRIYGRVFDRETGAPLPDSQVIIKLDGASAEVGDLARRAGFSLINDRLRTNEDGDYEFRHLPFGDYRMLSSSLEHALTRGAVSVSETAPDARYDFALEKGSSVIISITDLEGKPVEIPRWSTRPGVFTGYLGHIIGMRAGTFDFAAMGIGYEIQFRKDVVFKPGEPTELEFRLAPEAWTKVEFTDPQGVPLEGVRVATWKDGRNLDPYFENFLRGYDLVLGTTGPAGYVDIRAVRAGPVRIVAKKSGYAPFDRSIELKQGRERVRLKLEPAATVFRWRVRIASLYAGGLAERIGLRIGDVILSYDGSDLDSIDALPRAIHDAKTRGADSVTLAVRRDGDRFETKVAPGALGVSLEEFEAR